jgi:16S rRNA (guanine966-N2)-methyltransferase
VTRIIAGRVGGRRLVVPRGDRTRPTSERVREATFAALQSRGRLVGARVLDLFAGCGALGLEAASRGAASVTLVEVARSATHAARRNVSALGLPGVDVVQAPVERYLSTADPVPADLVLADPPYDLPEPGLERVLDLLIEAGWLAPGAAVVVERSARSPEPCWPHGLARTALRRYGDTVVWTAERTGDEHG